MAWAWRTFQEEVISEAVNGDGSALIPLPRGAGKTPTAVEIIRRRTADIENPLIVVVAPIATFAGWLKHFKMFMPEYDVNIIDGSKSGKASGEAAMTGQPGVYLVGWEFNRRHDWSKIPIDAVIVDECHRMGNRKAKQSTAVHSMKHAPTKICLSATPAGNKIENIWSVLHFLWPAKFKHFWPFVKTFLVTRRDPFAGMAIVGEKRPGQIAKAIPLYLKRTEEEVHGELPEVVVHEVEVSLTPTQYKIYKQFEQDSLAWLDAHPVAAALPMTKRARMLQTCLAVPSVIDDEVVFEPGAKSSKIDAVLDILQDLGEDEKVIIWTHSRRIIPVVVDRLNAQKYKTSVFLGGQSKAERQKNVDDFLSGDAQVMVATIAAMGEGFDGAQHVCNTEIWLSIEDSGVLNFQAEGRLRRPGQKHVINRYFINAQKTVEVQKVGRIESNRDKLKQAGML